MRARRSSVCEARLVALADGQTCRRFTWTRDERVWRSANDDDDESVVLLRVDDVIAVRGGGGGDGDNDDDAGGVKNAPSLRVSAYGLCDQFFLFNLMPHK